MQHPLQGIDPLIEADGYFGPRTERAVREFQRRSGLEVDGLVGPTTWLYLTGGRTEGTDFDGSGVIDPWEAGVFADQ